MQIQPASSSNVEYISNSLVNEYKRTNREFGYQRYKEDYDLMYKHVSKRIGEGGEFKYFVALENGKEVGFINIMIDDNGMGSILMLCGDRKDIKEGLIMKSIEYFKENSVKSVLGEVMMYDKESIEILNTLGMREVMMTFKIEI